MSNAAKFTSNGVISLDVSVDKSAKVNEVDAAQKLVIHVNDTGIGMAEDSVEDIFRPFAGESLMIGRTMVLGLVWF